MSGDLYGAVIAGLMAIVERELAGESTGVSEAIGAWLLACAKLAAGRLPDREAAEWFVVCDYVGGMIPFAKTRAERLASGDPRLSLEERYGTHAGYVQAVAKAAARAVAANFLLKADADALIAEADASNVLK